MLRFGVTTNDRVIFAYCRSSRPHEFEQRRSPAPAERAGLCPIWPGNEHLTPPEVFAARDGSAPNSRGWKVGVMSNIFLALWIEEILHRGQVGRLFSHMGGCSAQEVIVDQSATAANVLRDYRALAAKLYTHEAAENRLLQMAFGAEAADYDVEGDA